MNLFSEKNCQHSCVFIKLFLLVAHDSISNGKYGFRIGSGFISLNLCVQTVWNHRTVCHTACQAGSFLVHKKLCKTSRHLWSFSLTSWLMIVQLHNMHFFSFPHTPWCVEFQVVILICKHNRSSALLSCSLCFVVAKMFACAHWWINTNSDNWKNCRSQMENWKFHATFYKVWVDLPSHGVLLSLLRVIYVWS